MSRPGRGPWGRRTLAAALGAFVLIGAGPSDTWEVVTGKYKGKPIIVRFDRGLARSVGDPGHPYQVGIAVPLLHPGPHGFPKDEELPALREIEESIVTLFQPAEDHLLAMVISTNGMREFVIYSASPEKAKERFAALRQRSAGHTPQFMVHEDKAWTVYKTLKAPER